MYFGLVQLYSVSVSSNSILFCTKYGNKTPSVFIFSYTSKLTQVLRLYGVATS